MTDIVAIDRVYRQWVNMSEEYPTASMKFRTARTLAAEDFSGCVSVTADEFFKYLAGVKRANRTPRRRFRPVEGELHFGADDGDFDDMGRGRIAAQYHYDQKRKHGRL